VDGGEANLEAKGRLNTVVFDGEWITISKSGLGRLAGGGEVRIPVSSVTAVMWKPANPLLNGYIHFVVPGSADTSRGTRGAANVRLSPNTVSFVESNAHDFERLRDAVERAIHGSRTARHTPSAADQIAQFAALKDQGILTEEEFSAKKARLLSEG
jgi:hypothetical protein